MIFLFWNFKKINEQNIEISKERDFKFGLLSIYFEREKMYFANSSFFVKKQNERALERERERDW